jgi:hypothetical protein
MTVLRVLLLICVGVVSRGYRIALRMAGFTGLGLGLIPCVCRSGTAIGIVIWLCMMMTVGMSFVFLFAYRPRLTVMLGALVGGPVGLVLLAIASYLR